MNARAWSVEQSASSLSLGQNTAGAAPRKLLGVEAARGIAAALVVAVHASHILADASSGYAALPLWGLFRFGRSGVDFFFVLSGFIIYYVHQADVAEHRGARAYVRKRLVRIYPTYWVVLAAYAVLLTLSPQKGMGPISLGEVVANVFLWPQQQAPILGVSWTLRHELLFYCIFGLLIFNRTVSGIVLILWAVFLVIGMSVILMLGAPLFQGILGSFVFRIFNIEFFFGMAVCQACVARNFAESRRCPYLRGGNFFRERLDGIVRAGSAQ